MKIDVRGVFRKDGRCVELDQNSVQMFHPYIHSAPFSLLRHYRNKILVLSSAEFNDRIHPQ